MSEPLYGWKDGKPFSFPAASIDFEDKFYLHVAAAKAFCAMAAAAFADNVPLKVNSAFRTYGAQALLRKKWAEGKGAPASKPGYSKHQQGLAVDINTGAGALAWLKKNASQYQFAQTVKAEPWHWEYTGLLS